ncbi:M50 family metallopeptidase [Priestia filamentosa]|uniref:M50 family metallopeptidase n=1 Tax=Priestia filamentosa TaxID=1402861 RepID=UPI00397E8AAF
MEHLNMIRLYVVVIAILTIGITTLGHWFIRSRAAVLFANTLIEVGKYVALANTLIHEVFHCLASWLTGGRAHSISLHHDTSGLATTSTSSRFSRIVVGYAGYTGSSIMAFVFFYLLSKGYYSVTIYVFSGFLVIGLLLWTKNFFSELRRSVVSLFKLRLYRGNNNFFGLIWSLIVALYIFWILYTNNTTLIVHTSICIAAIVLLESVKTAFVILILSAKDRKDAGDATSLAKSTFIPALIWGLVFFGQAAYVGVQIFKHYLI